METYEEFINEGKLFLIQEEYEQAQNSFVEASKLNSDFVSDKFKKFQKGNGYSRNDYKQECLDMGIIAIFKDVEKSIGELDLQNMFNPFKRDIIAEQNPIIALLDDYLLLSKRCMKNSSKSKNWAYAYKIMGDISVKLKDPGKAYSFYKKSLYFNKSMDIKPLFNKLAKQFGSDDKISEDNFNYKLINKISFEELEDVVINNGAKSKYRFELNGQSVTVEEVSKHHYEMLGFNVLIGENHFWWSTADIFFHDLDIMRIIQGYDYKTYLDQLKQRINEFYDDSNALNFVKKYYELNKKTRSGEYIDKIGFSNWFAILDKMGLEKGLMLSKELKSHDPQKLPTSGFPDLIVWNNETFFFVEIKSTNDKLSERQKWWHLYISEELKFPIVLFMVNKNEKQIMEIKKHYLIK